MKKKLVVIRHAKANDITAFQKDFERNLNGRGRIDAELMANRLKDHEIIPDLILASSAQRTKETAEIFATALNVDLSLIKLEKQLYNASAETISETVSEMSIPDSVNTLFLIGHNPGISEFAFRSLKNPERMTSMPTCGIVVVEQKLHSWNDFRFAAGDFVFYDYPKNK